MNIELTFEPKTDDDKLKATLSYDDTNGGVVEIKSGTLAPVTGNGGVLEPLYTADMVDVTITPPADKVPVLHVKDVPSNLYHPFGPDPMNESSGIYTTAFTMQNEDVIVETRFEAPLEENERYVTLTVQGPANSGEAEMTDPNGVPPTTGDVTVGNWSLMKAILGDTMTITVNPASGYAVAAVDGVVVYGIAVPVSQTGPYTYTFDLPATVAPGTQVDAVVTFEEAKTDLRVDLVKNDPAPVPSGNVAWKA